ncbi:MAG: vWA domain-containing protein, partial [Desulfobacterales bacterium]
MKSLIPNSFKYPSLLLNALMIYFVLMLGLSLSGCQPRPIKSGTTWQGTYFPDPQVEKRLTLPEGVDCLQVDQEFQVSIEVHGDSKEMDIPVPMNVVFIIDQSGSMAGNDPNGLRIQAVENFLASLNQRAIEDYAAIIEYGSYAQGLYPATSVGVAPSLVKVTDHYLNMTSALATRNLNCTNIAQAMELANSALINSGSDAKRIAILLTDGLPEKEYWAYDIVICEDDWDQLDLISDLSQEAFENGIRYYTIGLGTSVVEMILDDAIAQTTFGRYCPANTDADLGTCFNAIWESESQRMTTQNIVVEERLVQGFKYKENSFDYSGGVSFADDALTTFETNGQIDVQMGHLDENRVEIISFSVSCDECVEPVMPSETVSEDQLYQYLPVNISNAAANNARVRYHLGDGVDRYDPLPAMEVCVERPGGPTIEKTFDDVNNVVTLRIKSNYLTSHPEHIIRDIHVKEILSFINFEPNSKMDIAGPLTDLGQIDLIKMPFSIQPDSVRAFDNGQKWTFVYRWSI